MAETRDECEGDMPEEKVSIEYDSAGYPHKVKQTPAADAGPRQPCPHVNTMGHEGESHCVDCGEVWKHNPTPYSVTLAAPPVPQEAAPSSYVETSPGVWQGSVGPRATAPDSAMRLSIDICRELYDRFMMGGWEPQDAHEQCAALIRQAGSERERRIVELCAQWLEREGERFNQRNGATLRIAAKGLRAEASRLLGGESK